ncbi:MAG: isochorismate synthase [Kineosporiaceae bacterium]
MTTAAAAALPLVARTVALPPPGRDPGLSEPSLLDLLPGHEPGVSWVRRGDGLVGWGEVARIDVAGPCRFAEADAAWSALTRRAVVRDEVGLPGCGPVAFGSFSFSPDSPSGGSLIVPRVVVGRRGDTWWLTTVGLGSMPPVERPRRHPSPPSPGQVTYRDGALDADHWSDAVAVAVKRIADGDLDKAVLARDVWVHTEAPIDVRHLLRRLAARYPSCWTFAVDGLVGATPEMLVRREKGLVTSRVLAGTIRRTGDDASDLALAATLARSSKDLEEHEYAVRSVAEALAPACRSMNVPEAPYVLHLPNVMHLATDVTGVLCSEAEPASSLQLAQALHPSAAVCGTPREEAAALIAELEEMDRDRYAGPVGWIDAGGDGEWGIGLRSGRLDRRDRTRMRLFAGCGIVAGSDPASELAESRAKLVPMQEALGSTAAD